MDDYSTMEVKTTSQVRPIMKILNQVRELIINAHNAGEQKGRKEVVDWGEEPCPHGITKHTKHYKKRDCPDCWQAKLKEWGIE